MLSKLKKIIYNNNNIHLFFIAANLTILRVIAILVPDRIYVRRQYRKHFGRELNLKNPRSFNEKIQWLKLNWKDEILSACADKYKVREYVENRVGERVLTKLYGVYDRVEDIILDNLPDSFVLKITHGSGQNIICKNKKDIDWKYTFKLLKIFMYNNHYYCGREFAYKNIQPRIICEEYLGDKESVPVDYKFFCFNGEPRFLHVDFDRFTEHKRNLYDMDWNLLPVRKGYLNSTGQVERPGCFKEMSLIARQLCQGLIFVRVDLYDVDNKVYFGELTFYPSSGCGRFDPDSYDYTVGAYLQLPGQKNY